MDDRIIEGVGHTLRHAARSFVLPRFTRLAPGESALKAPGELVTIADKEAEAAIGGALLSLLPGSRVVGEEACAHDPGLLDHLDEGLVWIVDPIDGTANFAAGKPQFAMMVALLSSGETVGAWILDPLEDRLAVAQAGAGAWIEGRRLAAALPPAAIGELRGIISNAFRVEQYSEAVARLEGLVAGVVPTVRCAGHEYPSVATGGFDFAIYWRTLVWDHAPGALLLREAGGLVTHLDGSAYAPTRPRPGLLLANNAQVSRILLNEFTSPQ